MAEDSVGQASQPWTDCKWAKSYVQELHELYQSGTLVGDEERSFESLVEPLHSILVPVATTTAGRRSLRCSINLTCSQEIQQKKEENVVLSLAKQRVFK